MLNQPAGLILRLPASPVSWELGSDKVFIKKKVMRWRVSVKSAEKGSLWGTPLPSVVSRNTSAALVRKSPELLGGNSNQTSSAYGLHFQVVKIKPCWSVLNAFAAAGLQNWFAKSLFICQRLRSQNLQPKKPFLPVHVQDRNALSAHCAILSIRKTAASVY